MRHDPSHNCLRALSAQIHLYAALSLALLKFYLLLYSTLCVSVFSRVSVFISASDAVCVLIFLVIAMHIHDRIEAVSREVDGSNVKSSDYSVLVRGLPKDASEREILEHFQRLYDVGKEDWTYPGNACFCGRKMRKRPKEGGRTRVAAAVRFELLEVNR